MQRLFKGDENRSSFLFYNFTSQSKTYLYIILYAINWNKLFQSYVDELSKYQGIFDKLTNEEHDNYSETLKVVNFP